MPLLTDPLHSGSLNLRNRLVLPSVSTSTADEEGKVTEATLNFFRERTKGFGLTILEHSYVSSSGKAGPHMLSISSDSDIEGLAKLVKDSGAELVGAGIVIEKGFQPGGDNLRKQGIRLESLAIVDSMDEEKGTIVFRDDK